MGRYARRFSEELMGMQLRGMSLSKKSRRCEAGHFFEVAAVLLSDWA